MFITLRFHPVMLRFIVDWVILSLAVGAALYLVGALAWDLITGRCARAFHSCRAMYEAFGEMEHRRYLYARRYAHDIIEKGI